MSNFQHLEGMRNLLIEIYEVNERIMTGDICSAKSASRAPVRRVSALTRRFLIELRIYRGVRACLTR